MRRAAAVLLLAAAALAVAGGCGSSTAHAATVNGAVISDGAVLAELKAADANPDYIKKQEQQSGATIQIRGNQPGSYSAAYVSLAKRCFITMFSGVPGK